MRWTRHIPAFAPLALSCAGLFCVIGARAQDSPAAAAHSIPAPAPPQGQPVVLDHVVAIINGDIILQSDVNDEMRFANLQTYRIDPARNTPQGALQRLVDRNLILQQMKFSQAVTPPTDEQVQQQLSALRTQIPECAEYHCNRESGWRAFLKAEGLTDDEVVQYWRQRMLILSFIQSRFGAGIRISPQETQQYYEKSLVPEFVRRKLKPPPVAEVSSRIQEILLQQRVNSLLVEWLKSLKDEGSVSILDPAYGQVGDAEPEQSENQNANPEGQP